MGAWGEPTAAIDWCETNYDISFYASEFHNTWTNVFYVGVGTVGICTTSRRLLPANISIVLTGVFSAAFHATLWWWFWKLDEVFENGILIALIHVDRGESWLGLLHFAIVTTGILSIPVLFCEVHLVLSVVYCIRKFYLLSTRIGHVQKPIKMAGVWAAVGATFWLLDKLACDHLQQLPLNPQLHGWWHFCTATALWFGIEGADKYLRIKND